MAQDNKVLRLSKVAREFNVGINTIVEFLHKKGVELDSNPNSKIDPDMYTLLLKEYSGEINVKKESEKIAINKFKENQFSKENADNENLKSTETFKTESLQNAEVKSPKIIGKINLEDLRKNESKNQDLKNEPKFIKKEIPEIKEKIEIIQPEINNEKIETLQQIEKTENLELTEKIKKTDISEKTEIVDNKKSDETIKTEFIQNEPEIKEQTPIIINETKIVNNIEKAEIITEKSENKLESDIKVIGRIDLDLLNQKTRPAKKTKKQKDDDRREKERLRKEAYFSDKRIRESVTDQNKETNREAPKLISKENVANRERLKNKEKEQTREIKHLVKKPIKKDSDSGSNPEEIYKTERTKLSGPTVVGKIDLPSDTIKTADGRDDKKSRNKKKKRKRINKELVDFKEFNPENSDVKRPVKVKPPVGVVDTKSSVKKAKPDLKKGRKYKNEVNNNDVQKQVKETLAQLSQSSKSKSSKYRREKRDDVRTKTQEKHNQDELDKKVLKVTEFISANELATLMEVHVNQIIATCMDLGTKVSINQRLDAEIISILASEFGFEIEFITAEVQEAIEDEVDSPENLKPRSPIVTVMGHVDHGKTSLLDYIRNTNVIAGEAGGITQHIGAYSVTLENGREITFLDTPGHEAFTAMRARGAKVTDIAIIVVAADDHVMPQTIEAINHAQAANVPIVFAINKIDKDGANPEKIKEQLANMNILVEDWGGKYGSVNVSAKKGINIQELLDRVLLEAELLDLKANPDRNGVGTIIESSLDKGRGYVTTVLVQNGSMQVGDIIWAGSHYGKIKAMFDERSKRIRKVGPSDPVLILGLDGAPEAGEKFRVMNTDRDAKDKAQQRLQIQREINIRTQRHLTLDEIGRRIAIGGFKEVNLIVKGDVVGSIEALSDSLIKLSTNEIQVNVIHKAVGQISESDVMLASASEAIIIGFQVRPSSSARKLAEKEEIDIRLYSIIYDAINDLKSAMEGMLSPEIKEEIVGTAEIVETFKITKVGTVAGCMVKEGKIIRNNRIRIIRDGIVVYTGELGSLKRFKDDTKEVAKGFECGLNIERFNDIKVGDFIESFIEKEYKKTL